MLLIKDLKKLIEKLTDDASAVAYEGEGCCGLWVEHHGCYGWIETGFDDEAECDHKEHDLSEIIE